MNSIVILNYNNWKETIEYINKINSYNVLDYIVVVDNASTDDSYIELQKHRSNKIIILNSKKNGGYNAGNNIGINYSVDKLCCKNVIVSNPDIDVTEDDLEIIYNDLNSNLYGVVAPLVFNLEGQVQSNCGWNLPSYFQSVMNCSLITYKLLKKFNKSNYFSAIEYKDDVVPVEAVSGCFFGITAEAFLAVGGFDEENFLYGEEILLGALLKKYKYQAIIDKSSSVIHYDQGSKKESLKKWMIHMNMIRKSHVHYLKKFLYVNSIKIKIYNGFFWVGAITNFCITRVIR